MQKVISHSWATFWIDKLHYWKGLLIYIMPSKRVNFVKSYYLKRNFKSHIRLAFRGQASFRLALVLMSVSSNCQISDASSALEVKFFWVKGASLKCRYSKFWSLARVHKGGFFSLVTYSRKLWRTVWRDDLKKVSEKTAF
jgi:hypothetical protein